MRTWVMISGVNEAITAKDIAKLYTYLPECDHDLRKCTCDME